MKNVKLLKVGLYVTAGLIEVIALILTFTISDYYIFNRISTFGFVFALSQWVKKAALLLIPLAVFYCRKSCSDIVKWGLPLFVILSCCLFGGFFDVTKTGTTAEQIIYNSINAFMPKWLNITLFFMQNALMLFACALLFVRDGFGVNGKSFIYSVPAMLLCMPLNIFENFFNIDNIPARSFLRFYNFTIWHLLAIMTLGAFTVGCYLFLRKKDRDYQNVCLAAVAIALLIQYHSKDSVVMGDGYNVYHTVLACIPLFICNLGVYVAALSVLVKKPNLYKICFFIHAAGALSVFVYFGKNSMSNYGIFASYSILYFCFTHCLLFALCVLPSALGMYKFKLRDCMVPLVYYFIVIITASVCSALVTSASMGWHTPNGDYLTSDQWLMPNYAFTQINPLPFEVPAVLEITIWRYKLNVLYVLGLYMFYVALFFTFTGLYYLFLFVRKKVIARHIYRGQLQIESNFGGHAASDEKTKSSAEEGASKEVAAADEEEK